MNKIDSYVLLIWKATSFLICDNVQSGSLVYEVTIPDPSNNSYLKIMKLHIYSNVYVLPAQAARGQHCSPLLRASNLIPEGTVETEITKRKWG